MLNCTQASELGMAEQLLGWGGRWGGEWLVSIELQRSGNLLRAMVVQVWPAELFTFESIAGIWATQQLEQQLAP